MDIEVPGYRVAARIGGPAGDRPAPEVAARVFRGARLRDGLPVALKVFHAADADRAQRESDLAGAVEHPHLVPVLDLVVVPDWVVLVTPLAAGGSLADLLDARLRLRWPEILTVLIPLADALAAAHERGVVHGDVSAGNVLFDAGGRPLLADLGAARAVAELGGPVALTPAHAAPEIARGADPTPASDLFSLGSVALQCLSGRPAWPAEDLRDVLIQSASGQWPEPDELMAPAPLLDVVRRLLEPEPAQRGSAAQAAVELRRVGEPEPLELMTLSPGGAPTRPAPATVVRPDAARPPRATGRRRSRRWPRARRTSTGPSGRHRRTGWAARVRGTIASRRGPGSHRPRWSAVLLVVALAALLVGAVQVGLWWSRWGRAEPTSAAALSGSGAASGAAGPAFADPPPADPSSADPSSADPPPADPSSADPPPDGVDWRWVVSSLDAARASALTARDPAMLAEVYTEHAPARAVDALRIETMRDSGYHVTAAGHRLAEVTLIGRGADGSVSVRVVEELPSYPVLDEQGAVIGSTTASRSVVTLDLRRTTDGFRIASIGTG